MCSFLCTILKYLQYYTCPILQYLQYWNIEILQILQYYTCPISQYLYKLSPIFKYPGAEQVNLLCDSWSNVVVAPMYLIMMSAESIIASLPLFSLLTMLIIEWNLAAGSTDEFNWPSSRWVNNHLARLTPVMSPGRPDGWALGRVALRHPAGGPPYGQAQD